MNKKNCIKSNNIYYYCSNYRTTVGSNKYTSKGNIKKVSLCYARIVYFKDEDNFYMDYGHSDECLKLNKPLVSNFSDINKEIKKYKKLKQELKKYLVTNPLSNLGEFKVYAKKIYDKYKCNYKLKIDTFKNFYNNWKNNSKVYSKLSIFDNTKTLNNKEFLRDYTYTLIYNTNGKSQFIHEHIIYISNFFIKKIINFIGI